MIATLDLTMASVKIVLSFCRLGFFAGFITDTVPEINQRGGWLRIQVASSM